MLDAVLADYLSRLREREFDAPFLTLLRAMGFEDVHFTHGTDEFGKDFIAKKVEDGRRVQYAFQTKAGKVTQSVWRHELMGQVLQALTTDLCHPHFDSELPRRVVAVSTGRFTSNASVAVQALNTDTVSKLPDDRLPVRTWGLDRLVALIRENGLEGIHPANSEGYRSYAAFFEVYGRLAQRTTTPRDLERYSRDWLRSPEDVQVERLVFRAVCEASILSSQLSNLGDDYLAAHSMACALRAVWFHAHPHGFPKWAESAADACMSSFVQYARRYCDEVLAAQEQEPRGWFAGGGAAIMTYPITCARLLEVASLLVLIGNDTDERYFEALATFVEGEPGSRRPPADTWTISTVLTTLALVRCGRFDMARSFVKDVVVWVCDRYEAELSLAGLESGPLDELRILLAGEDRRQSYLATGLVDLAAWLRDPAFYRDAVNDFLAARVVPVCFMPQANSRGQYRYEARDVLKFPSLSFMEELPEEGQTHGEHLEVCSQELLASEKGRPVDLLVIATVLRDRHFPSTWTVCAQPAPQEES